MTGSAIPSVTASLWPLAPGKTARYIESGRWHDSEGKVHTYTTQWRSEVAGQMRIRVKAGEFERLEDRCPPIFQRWRLQKVQSARSSDLVLRSGGRTFC